MDKNRVKKVRKPIRFPGKEIVRVFAVIVVTLFSVTVALKPAMAWEKNAWSDCSSVGAYIVNLDSPTSYSGYITLEGLGTQNYSGVAQPGQKVQIERSVPSPYQGNSSVHLQMGPESVDLQNGLSCGATATPTATGTPCPTNTPPPPTATEKPTETQVPPTQTQVPPTETPKPTEVPNTPTAVPSQTPPPPTGTPVPTPTTPGEIITYPGADLLVSSPCVSATAGMTSSLDVSEWYKSYPVFFDGDRTKVRDEIVQIPNVELLVSVEGGKILGGVAEGSYMKFEVGTLYLDKISHVKLSIVVTNPENFKLTVLVRAPNQAQIGDNLGNNVSYSSLCTTPAPTPTPLPISTASKTGAGDGIVPFALISILTISLLASAASALMSNRKRIKQALAFRDLFGHR